MKSRHDAADSCSDTEPVARKETSFVSDSDSFEKENQPGKKIVSSNKAPLDSSDEDFDQSKSLRSNVFTQ